MQGHNWVGGGVLWVYAQQLHFVWNIGRFSWILQPLNIFLTFQILFPIVTSEFPAGFTPWSPYEGLSWSRWGLTEQPRPPRLTFVHPNGISWLLPWNSPYIVSSPFLFTHQEWNQTHIKYYIHGHIRLFFFIGMMFFYNSCTHLVISLNLKIYRG